MNIIFMGTPDFAVPCLDKMVAVGYQISEVVTQPDRPKGRKKELTPPPVKIAALRHSIPVFQPEKLREADAVQHIISLNPDLIITAAYGQILPTSILQLPRYGCINVHASLLPKYRGGAPIHQSIIDGEKETGVTIMYMVEKLDAGDILTQVKVPIEEDDTVGKVHDKLAVAGSDLLMETIPKLVKGELHPRKQDDALVTFARNIQREDELIHWNKPAREIYNQIRGLNPWPVAFTMFKGEVFKVWWAQVMEQSLNEQKPGTILQISTDGIDVACGEGVIRLLEVQPAGKKKLSVADYVRGAGEGLSVGTQFEF